MISLDFVPAPIRPRVSAIFRNEAIDYDGKVKYLRSLISDGDVLNNVIKLLKKEPEFLKLMSGDSKLVAELAYEMEDIGDLEKIVSCENEAVKRAFALWKNANKQQTPQNFSPPESTTSEEIGIDSDDAQSDDVGTEDEFDPQPPAPSPPPPSSFRRFSSNSRETPPPNRRASARMSPRPPKFEESTFTPNLSITEKLYESFPDGANILFLGCTGAGKSTFINALPNYLKHETFEAAMTNGVEILIETSFEHFYGNQYQRQSVKCKPTIFIENPEKNENTNAGESSTQFPRSYKLSWGSPQNRKTVRIIDTPGVDDVRGAEKEHENFANILKFLTNFTELHAIVILLKANDSRATVAFRYCINELLAHLHESACKNILFCFTHGDTPGDTLETLEAHLEKLSRDKGIKVPLTLENMFCFNNESFRTLCAAEAGLPFNQKEVKKYEKRWNTSVMEAERLLKKVGILPVHHVDDTLCVNNVRGMILGAARPLAEISELLIRNQQLVEEKDKEIDKLVAEGEDLRGKLYIDQAHLRVKEIEHPITVCNSSSCVEHERISPDSNETQKVFKKECHSHCYISGVEEETFPNPKLRNCAAMRGDNCTVCKCPWTTHMHIKYHLVKSMEKAIDKNVQNDINDKEAQVKAAEAFKTELEKKMSELRRKSTKISKYSAEFAAFLKKESLLSFNDAYGEYVEHLIREERAKVSLGRTNDVLLKLEKFRDDYKQQVVILTKPGRTTDHKSITEIYALLEELKQMEGFGTLLHTIQNIEVLTSQRQEDAQSVAVNLNTSNFSGRREPKKNNNLRKSFAQRFK